MRKKQVAVYFVGIIIVSTLLLFWLINSKSLIDYDDYQEMELLSEKSKTELENEGYSELEIKKIEAFSINHKNHLKLLNIIENNNLKNYGYYNRILKNEDNREIVYEKNDFTKENNHLTFNTSIIDLVRDENVNRDAARIIIEFDWKSVPEHKNQAINVTYQNYLMDNIYTVLKYENSNDQNDIVYKMAEIEPYNFLDEFYTDIDSRKNINKHTYVLKSGVIILDVNSYYVDSGIAPLSVTSQYLTKSLFDENKILSEQVIINANRMLKK